MPWKHVIYHPLSGEEVGNDLEFLIQQNTDFDIILHQSVYVSPNEIVLIFGPAPLPTIAGITA